MDVRLDVVVREVEPDVAVEVAVHGVAGVSLLGAPDLLAALDVPPERGDAGAAVDGGVHAVERARLGEEDAVRVHEEEADPLLAHQLVHARHVAALAEPHPLRPPSEEALVEVGRRVNLRAERRPVAIEEREERVRRRARDDFEAPRVLQRAEAPHEVALVAPPAVADLVEPVAVHLRQLVEGVVLASRAVDLLLGELDELVELLAVPLLQQLVGHHRQERRAEAQREAEVDVVAPEALEGEE